MAGRAARTRAGEAARDGLVATTDGGTPTVAVPGLIVGPLGQAVMTALADADRFDLFDSPPVAARGAASGWPTRSGHGHQRFGRGTGAGR